ncbi:MAG: M20/M25/M40 family metallo-hydrolase [Planctomycetota bacterium]|nr:M20/M25/M40 family metallo-hydrolase [Planctomycetota bacterium]MDA1248290.1 M20/M25/M40 family metallo-hydrolase [Planctomycetota bacterium]
MAKRKSALTGNLLNENAAVRLVTEMMAIPGKSGEEKAVSDFIQKKLRDAGVPASAITTDSAHKKSRIGGQVGNLIVKLPGTVKGPRRLLMAHIDTVPLCVGCEPVRDGSVIRPKQPTTALGGDDRAGASVVLTAVLEILKQGLPHPPLTLFWAVQEEVGLVGARNVSVNKLGNPKLAFNWDGGAASLLTIGATGDYAIEVTVEGIASHAGAHPEDGVSAVAIASLAIADLVENGWHGLIKKGNNAGTSNIGVVSGGDATNVVMPKLQIRAEARSHDPKFRLRIVDEIRKAFERAAKKLKNSAGRKGSVTFWSDLKYESFALDPKEASVQAAKAVIESLGLDPVLKISNGGLDANWMSAHGVPTVTLGCGQDGIHTVNERLHVDSFLQACAIGLKLATASE